MSIFLISRTPDTGSLQFTSKPGADTNDPQMAVNRYKGSNVLVAWTYDNPSGALKETYDAAVRMGRTIERSPWGGWAAKRDGLSARQQAMAASNGCGASLMVTVAKPYNPHGGEPMKSFADPSKPMTMGEIQANAKMILRDGPAKAPAVAMKAAKVTVGTPAHPNPFARVLSPDLKASSHQVDPSFALAADRS